jgi:uncharacterized membrane protein YcjF (UPF0283 family)
MTEQRHHWVWDQVLIVGIVMTVLGLGVLFLQGVDMVRSNRVAAVDAKARIIHEQYVMSKFAEVFEAVKANEKKLDENRARIDTLSKGAGDVH